MSSSPPNPRAAYCEEYSEDAHTTLPETRQTANSAAKRSSIARLKISDTRDERSDSGTSSQTVTTLNSGDSSLELKAGARPLRPATQAPAIKRRPTLPAKKLESRQPSPPKPSQHHSSSKVRDERAKKQDKCKCSDCKAEARKSLTPLETSWPAAVNRQVRPKHEESKTPQSARPSLPRVTQAVPPIYPPVQPRPRAMTSYGAARPISYHGAMPGVVYPQSQPQPMFIERRAQTPYPTPLTFPPPSYPPNRGSYFPTPQAPAPRRLESYPFLPSPYDLPPRPQSRQWPLEHPSNRHSMVYSSSPAVEYPQQPQYVHGRPSGQPTSRPLYSDYDPSPPPHEDNIPRDEDHYHMPPPPLPPVAPAPKLHHRPAIKHAATTSNAHPQLHHPHSRDITSGHRSPRKEQAGDNVRSRRPSLASRPTATPSIEKSSYHMAERGLARLTIESNEAATKHRRRASYYAHETPHDPERIAESYQADMHIAAEAVPMPITSDSLKLVHKKTHSDTGSRASAEGRGSREGSDVKPRSSTDRRSGSDVKARNDNGGFTVRFHPSSGVNLDVNPGSVGRTISLRQSREAQGEMELSFGSKERQGLSRTASRNEGRERHRNRYPSVSGTGNMEIARSTSRMRGERDKGRERTRSVAGSRSRRSSRSGYSGKGTYEPWN